LLLDCTKTKVKIKSPDILFEHDLSFAVDGESEGVYAWCWYKKGKNVKKSKDIDNLNNIVQGTIVYRNDREEYVVHSLIKEEVNEDYEYVILLMEKPTT
jgi:hypothetical protein